MIGPLGPLKSWTTVLSVSFLQQAANTVAIIITLYKMASHPTTPTRKNNKRGRDEQETALEAQGSSDVIKEILKEMRSNAVLLRQVQEELAGVKDGVAVIDTESKALTNRVGELAEAAITERDETELKSLSKEEKVSVTVVFFVFTSY